MPIYPYSFQLPPLNVQDIPNDGAPGEFLGINVGGALDWLPAGGGGSGDMLAANNLSELTNFATARTNIGLGTASTPTFANLTLTSPSLSSSAPVTISQTWAGTGSTVFTALKVNATTSGTTSSSSSLLLDLQVGTASKFSVDKSGNIVTTGTTWTNTSGNNLTISLNGGGVITPRILMADSSAMVGTDQYGSGINLASGSSIGWSNSGAAFQVGSPRLWRDADNTLALRNGALAQTFNVYGTYTSLTDYKRLSLSCSASTGNATIGVPFNSVLAVTGGSATATVATVTFAAQAAAFPVGSSVTVTGVTPAGYNATAVVTASTTTSVSYASTVNAAYVSGGTATISGSAALTLTAAGNVGIGTTSPTFRLSVQGDTECRGKLYVTQSSPTTALVFDSTVGGVHRIYAEATQHIALQSGGAIGNVGIGTSTPTSKLDVAGLITATGIAANGTNSPRVYALGDSTSTRGLEFFTGGNALYYREGGGTSLAMYPSGIKLNSVSSLGWCSTTPDGGAETFLLRDEQYHLALRNGTNGGKFSVYGTYPGAAWERFTITAPTSGNVLLGTYIGTGGVARGMEFQTDGVTRMTLATNGVVTFPISIVVNSAVRTGFINNVGDSLSMFSFVNDSTGTSTYAVGGSAPLMRFGGTTTSFPAIKRSSTTLQTRLADDSAFAPIQGKLTTDTAFTSGAITDTGYIVLYDSTGTAYKVACTPV